MCVYKRFYYTEPRIEVTESLTILMLFKVSSIKLWYYKSSLTNLDIAIKKHKELQQQNLLSCSLMVSIDFFKHLKQQYITFLKSFFKSILLGQYL